VRERACGGSVRSLPRTINVGAVGGCPTGRLGPMLGAGGSFSLLSACGAGRCGLRLPRARAAWPARALHAAAWRAAGRRRGDRGDCVAPRPPGRSGRARADDEWRAWLCTVRAKPLDRRPPPPSATTGDYGGRARGARLVDPIGRPDSVGCGGSAPDLRGDRAASAHTTRSHLSARGSRAQLRGDRRRARHHRDGGHVGLCIARERA
jgi:hypothetical protein